MTKNEFERLQPGQMIVNKKNPQWAFIVHQNFGDRVTASRTIEVRDPNEWDAVTEVKLPDIPPDDSKNLDAAAHELHETLKTCDWFSTIGIADNKIIIYTSKRRYPKAYTSYKGYPVSYKYFGKIAPLRGA